MTGAGRTDTGVHALGQVAHIDLEKNWPTERVIGAINYHLRPAPISIIACKKVDEDFHARFSAIRRCYNFRLVSRRAPLVHERARIWQIAHELNLKDMQDAATYLIGKHDFTTFRSSMCQAKDPVKTLDRLDIEILPRRDDAVEYYFTIEARSFLHNQVRSLVGSLERVGQGAWPVERMGEALAAKDRARCGPVCPPDGLYLSWVRYPDLVI